MKHIITAEDRKKGQVRRTEALNARNMRREAELMLLNRVLAEAAMPEWYPHQ